MSGVFDNYNHSKEIGGYFELEIKKNGDFLHSNALKLNSARNCFKYILVSKKPTKIYIPAYICNSMLQPLKDCDIEYQFYNIDEKFEITNDLSFEKNDFLLYVNYFGLKSDFCKFIADKYGTNLIIDNSQAFFEKPIKNIDTIYSPRKFFGVSDGGYLYTDSTINQKLDVDFSYDHISHLIGRIEKSASKFYNDFRISEECLSNRPIRFMSKFTSLILENIDYEKAKLKRERNFLFLHNYLKVSNLLDINIHSINGPMVYPYLTKNKNLRDELIKMKIYVAKYWEEVEQRPNVDLFEKDLVDKLVPLPIDQRYNLDDMYSIIRAIKHVK
ncbi:MAG: hypothetical protein RBT65_01380 [Methanolobus sp.]|jgi:hypothetical protein|nr:hypothetical protein [Methanolobus sp.]